MLKLIVTTPDLADDDELSRFARLYGGTIQRLVGSGLQLFDMAVRRPVARFQRRRHREHAKVETSSAPPRTSWTGARLPHAGALRHHNSGGS